MIANSTEREDFDSLSPILTNTVALTERSLQWATERLDTIPENSSENLDDRRWQAFLERLAIAGFQQWLEDGAISLPASQLPSLQPSTIDNFRIGSYRLHIAAINALSNNTLEVPIATVNVEQALAHLYVLTEVQEEIDQVQIIAGVWREQLIQTLNLSLDQLPQTLSVPLSAFTVEPEQLLLCLSCLEPTPVLEIRPVSTVQNVVSEAVEQIINAHDWLQGQVDERVAQMRWALLPPISPAMRPVRETVDAALEALALQGVQLPIQARGIGGPISLGSQVFQVYSWAWPIETEFNEPESDSEWALFLLLGPSIGESLPQGIQLQVSESDEVLTQETLAAASSEAYLFTQVQGAQTEQFVVRVTLPDGLEITLPAFGFEGAV